MVLKQLNYERPKLLFQSSYQYTTSLFFSPTKASITFEVLFEHIDLIDISEFLRKFKLISINVEGPRYSVSKLKISIHLQTNALRIELDIHVYHFYQIEQSFVESVCWPPCNRLCEKLWTRQ